MRAEGEADGGDAVMCGLPDPSADFDDAQAEGVELEAGGLGREQPASELIEQPVGCGVEQEAEGVGPEPMIAESVGSEGVLEVFDPVLRLAPVNVPVVEREGFVGAGGHDEASVRT